MSERERITISIGADENALIREESKRTDETFSGAIIRLAKLGLEHQRQAEVGGVVVRDADALAGPEPVPALLVSTVTTASTDIVSVPSAAVAFDAPTPALRTIDEPTVTGARPSYRLRTAPQRWWTPTPAGEPPVGSDKARWASVGLMSAMLAVMLVPGNGATAAAISKVALGQPGDGIAASNLLFERYSQRAGPLRHWDATNRLAENDGRVKACADRADRFADYRRLTRCEILVSSRKRAIEVGQGIVD